MLNEIQVAGLLHDIGKLIHKFNGNAIPHGILGGFALDSYTMPALDVDWEAVTYAVTNHHSVTYNLEFALGREVWPNMHIKEDNIEKLRRFIGSGNTRWDLLLKYIKIGDINSAYSDRGEIDGNRGTASMYAPLWSPIARLNNTNRVAVLPGKDYRTFIYNGDDDNMSTVLKNIPDFRNRALNLTQDLFNELKTVCNIDELDDVISKYFSTINSNTWRAHNTEMGTSVSSLYDHSKLATAIAAIAYINAQNNDKVTMDKPGVDLVHVETTGRFDITSFVREQLLDIGLYKVCILGSTAQSVYFLWPHSCIDKLTNKLRSTNITMYINTGQNLNWQIASEWDFRNYNTAAFTRFNTSVLGFDETFGLHAGNIPLEVNKKNENLLIAGYLILDFDTLMTNLLYNCCSLSSLVSVYHVFSCFASEAMNIIDSFSGIIVSINMSECTYYISKDNVVKCEAELIKLFKAYTQKSMGILCCYAQSNMYIDNNTFMTKLLKDKATTLTCKKDSYLQIDGLLINSNN